MNSPRHVLVARGDEVMVKARPESLNARRRQ